MTTREKLDAVYALDEERTQGDWYAEELKLGSLWLHAGHNIYRFCECLNDYLPEAQARYRNDCKYAAAAPTMVSLLKELEARIKVLGEALLAIEIVESKSDFLRYSLSFDPEGFLKARTKALAAIDLNKEWEDAR